MTTRRIAGICLVWTALALLPASAHEVRPGYLEIRAESGSDTLPSVWRVRFKQPLQGDRYLNLIPRLPADCSLANSGPPIVGTGFVTERFLLTCEGDLSSGELSIEGLDRTLTDVLVRIEGPSGEARTWVLRPEKAGMSLASDGTPGTRAYLRLGVEHLVFGIDHVLFVLGLLLLVKTPGRLLGVVTSFTVAHSITLALSSLGLVTLRPRPVEAVIALSILFLAVELVHSQRTAGEGKATRRAKTTDGNERSRARDTRLMQRAPWLLSFGFGLLHGFGFAGALGEIGLPPNAVAAALFLFNVGVELGQLMVLAAAGLVYLALRRLLPQGVLIPRLAAWGLGIVSAWWFVERTALIFMQT